MFKVGNLVKVNDFGPLKDPFFVGQIGRISRIIEGSCWPYLVEFESGFQEVYSEFELEHTTIEEKDRYWGTDPNEPNY